jgi:periplasmic mercuric ion binding protein
MKIMQKVLFIIAGIFLVSFANPACSNSGQDKKTETVKISASMHCQACADNIIKKLNMEPGVRKVSANPDTKIVVIDYNPKKTDPEKLAEIIRNLGYSASVIIE